MTPEEHSERNKIGLMATMIELLEATDHRDIRARLTSSPDKPPLIQGTLSTERPDVYAHNAHRKSVIVETVTKADLIDEKKLRLRLQLFQTAAQAGGWHYYLACYARIAPDVKSFCRKNRVRYSKLWEI